MRTNIPLRHSNRPSGSDTAADLKGVLVPVTSSNFATITDTTTISALLRDIDAYTGNIIVRAALRLAPYVFVRPGELRRAEWTEFDIAKEV